MGQAGVLQRLHRGRRAIFSTPNGPQPSLTGGLRTDQLFGRASSVTPNLEIYGQLSFGESRNTYLDRRQPSGQLGQHALIFSGNAFLRPEVQALLGANPSFVLARQNAEFPNFQQDVLNTSINATVGVMGKFADKWNWDPHRPRRNPPAQPRGRDLQPPLLRRGGRRARSGRQHRLPGDAHQSGPLSRMRADQPVRRGRALVAAIAYVFGDTQYPSHQQDGHLRLQHERRPVRPVGRAALRRVRRGIPQAEPGPRDQQRRPGDPWDRTGLRGVPSNAVRFRGTNVGVASGEVNVKEAYVEAVLPLLKDLHPSPSPSISTRRSGTRTTRPAARLTPGKQV